MKAHTLPASPVRMNYYYAKGEEVLGPKSLDELMELCRTGEIAHDTQVCTEAAESWQPFSSLVPIEQSPPEESSTHVSFQPPPLPLAAPHQEPPVLKRYEYSVVPFIAIIAHKEGSTAAATQLEDLIHSHARIGWEYVRLESLETYVAGENGCFGLGSTPPRTTVYSMVVFRR
jgi:GYF domain 2